MPRSASRSTIFLPRSLASRTEFSQEVLEVGVVHVDEVPQHVDLVIRHVGAQLDGGDDLDAVLDRGDLGLGDALGGVVVANGDDLEAVLGAQVYELRGSESSVGVGSVEMKVYFMHFGVLSVASGLLFRLIKTVPGELVEP